MASWKTPIIEANPIPEEEALEGRARLWFPIYRRELYIYFRVIIYIGIIIELAIEDYWGLIIKGAAYKVTEYILKNRF